MMMKMMKKIIALTQSIFKLGPPDFSWKQIQIVPTDDDDNNSNNDDDDDDDDGDDGDHCDNYNCEDDGDDDDDDYKMSPLTVERHLYKDV